MFHLSNSFVGSDLCSHVSCRWRQGIVGDLRGHVGRIFLHQNTPIQNDPPPPPTPQKPFAAMSNLAPSSVIAEAPVRVSPVMGCKVGSMQMSVQTSDRQLPI